MAPIYGPMGESRPHWRVSFDMTIFLWSQILRLVRVHWNKHRNQ